MKKDLTLNRDKLFKLLSLFDEAFYELKSLKEKPKADVISSKDRFILEHLFYRLSMIAIDICFHIVAKLRGKVPSTYKNCFQNLTELGIIDISTQEKLEELSGLRNLIAHVYWNIDYGRLYDFIDQLDELKNFRQKILSLLYK